jgi:hypothetical protein
MYSVLLIHIFYVDKVSSMRIQVDLSPSNIMGMIDKSLLNIFYSKLLCLPQSVHFLYVENQCI